MNITSTTRQKILFTAQKKNKNNFSLWSYKPAKSIQLGLAKEVVAVVANAVETREDAGVIDPLALQVEEGAPRHVVRGRRRSAQGQRQQRRASYAH